MCVFINSYIDGDRLNYVKGLKTRCPWISKSLRCCVMKRRQQEDACQLQRWLELLSSCERAACVLGTTSPPPPPPGSRDPEAACDVMRGRSPRVNTAHRHAVVHVCCDQQPVRAHKHSRPAQSQRLPAVS